jgi:hypothetical protein
MMNRSHDRSRLKIAFDYLNMIRVGTCISYKHCLIFYSILNVCSLIAIHQIRHSSSERETGFRPIRIRLVYHAQNELLHLLELEEY